MSGFQFTVFAMRGNNGNSKGDCKKLAEFIREQWATYWEYHNRFLTGNIDKKMKTLAHTYSDCKKIYPDEGRRRACQAHEEMHTNSQYISMVPEVLFKDRESIIRKQAAFELQATEAGIKKAESLYKLNCITVKGVK